MDEIRIKRLLESYTLNQNGFESVFFAFIKTMFVCAMIMFIMYGLGLLTIYSINKMNKLNKMYKKIRLRTMLGELYLKSFFNYKVNKTYNNPDYIKRTFLIHTITVSITSTILLYGVLKPNEVKDIGYKMTKATDRELKDFYKTEGYRKYIYSLPTKQKYVYVDNITTENEFISMVYKQKVFIEGTYFTSMMSFKTESFSKVTNLPKGTRGIITYVEIPFDLTKTRKKGTKEIISFTSRSDV